MAVATYTTDLLSFGTNVSSATGWTEPSGYTATDATGEVDTDLFIYGTSCYTEAQRKSGKGGLFYTTTEPAAWATGDCIFIWHKFFASTGIETKANGGIAMLIGSTDANFKEFYVNGSDTYAYGGWRNYVADPTVTASATTGSPSGVINGAGVGCNLLTGVAKGQSHNHDIYRWGRGEVVVLNGDVTNGYATFAALSAVNDNPTTGRWGLFQDAGGSYLWKGLMTLGTTTTIVDMRDSNVSITIDNTEYVTASFNRIEVNNAASNVSWTGISITALSTVAKGQFEAVDNATITMTGCTFTDMDSFVFQSNSTILTSTFRRCGLVTQGSSTITNTTFDAPSGTVGLLVNNLANVTGCTFNSDGTGHAVNMGTIAANVSYTWDNNDIGYTAASSGNETILVSVNTGVTLTINVAAGATSPSVYNTGAGTVNVVSGQVTLTITVKDTAGTVIPNAIVYVTADTGGALTEGTVIINKALTDVNGQVSDTRSYSGNQPITGRVRKSSAAPYYKTSAVVGTVSSAAGLDLTIQMISDQ